MALSASESEINERLLRNVKKEVKQLMEESVTRKFVHEESSTITALCSAVEACLQYGLRKRSLGLFKNSNTTTALLQKVSKTLEPAAVIVRSLTEMEKNLENSCKSGENGSLSASSTKYPMGRKYNSKYLWIRLALFEKQLVKIIEYLVENSSKYYDKVALMSDPVDGMILASLLVGPCALEYTRMKTPDHYWTDPPADELVQRHRIRSSGSHYIPVHADSPKRPGLQMHKTASSSSEDQSRPSSATSAKEYVESLHQNAKSTLLYGKNNVVVQPKEDVEPLAGYLSLHQNADGLAMKWTPNQLMKGGGSEDEENNTTVDRRPIYARYASRNRLRSAGSNRRALYWDYAITVCIEDIVYLHCHQQPDCGGTVVFIGQDGVQRPPIHFPKGGHLMAFLSCLENGLLPRGQLDPPLWSQRTKIAGKVFPKLKQKTGPVAVLSSLIRTSVAEEVNTPPTTTALGASVDDVTSAAGGDEETSESLDYVFRIVYMQRPDAAIADAMDSKMKGKASDEGPVVGTYDWLVNSMREVTVQPAATDIVVSSSSAVADVVEQSEAVAVFDARTAVKQLCDTMKGQILSRAFYGWLSHCRHLKTVRTHLSGLVNPLIVSVDYPVNASYGVTREILDKMSTSATDDLVASEAEVYRHVYYGGCSPEIRQQVWPFLLGYYKFGSSESERVKQDASMRQQYERSMSEWLAIEAIIQQREREAPVASAQTTAAERTSDSQDGTSSVELPPAAAKIRFFRNNSSLSNDVFESIDGTSAGAGLIASCDDSNRPETVVEESSNATTPTVERSSVTTDGGGASEVGNGLPAPRPTASSERSDRVSTTEQHNGNLSPDDGLGSSIAATRLSALSDSSRRVDSCDTDRGLDDIVRPDSVSNIAETGDKQRNIFVTGATVDVEGLPAELATRVINKDIASCIGEADRRLSTSQESLVCPASPLSNTSNGGIYSTELLDSVALNLHRIDKDVHRCDRNNAYFATMTNLEKLRNIMCTYVWENLEVGYIQGMCDLLAPLLVIFDDEVKTYSCFCQLMKRMSINFPQGGAMDQHFGNMRSLIQILDPELFEHMRQNGDYTHFYFCYRWFLLDFKRELVYDDVFTVWETIWSAKHVSSPHFVLFIALALVEYYREIIIDNNMDFTDIIKFFNEMAERHNAKEVLQIARGLVHRLQALIENK